MKKKITVKKLDKRLWRIFSRYIRARDAVKTTGSIYTVNCITCGKRKSTKEVDAGHYLSRSHASLKYDERNVHAQCKHCNMPPDPGEIHIYKERVKSLYGVNTPDELYKKKQKLEKRNTRDIEDMIKRYKEKLEQLTSEHGNPWKT